MQRIMCKSKIHRASITQADIHYVGSITIDEKLLNAANLIEYEQVQIVNINNGNRFVTYVIKGKPGSGIICINGAASRLVSIDDLVIIMSFANYNEQELISFNPIIVHVNEYNQIINVNHAVKHSTRYTDLVT